jgi:hypothetical protein
MNAGISPEKLGGMECSDHVIVRSAFFEQSAFPGFSGSFLLREKNYEFREFRRSPHDRRVQRDE